MRLLGKQNNLSKHSDNVDVLAAISFKKNIFKKKGEHMRLGGDDQMRFHFILFSEMNESS